MKKKLDLPKLAIFDMDGLLLDTEVLFRREKGIVMKKYGYIQRDEDYEKTLGVGGEKLAEILLELYGPDYPSAAVSRETRARVSKEIMENGAPVLKGIPELLAWFRENRVLCCVASSTQTPVVESYLARAGLDGYFSFVIGGEQVTLSKPDPMIFLTACERAQADPKDSIVFEDSKNGVAAAVRGGIPVICIPNISVPGKELLDQALAVVPSAFEALDLFR